MTDLNSMFSAGAFSDKVADLDNGFSAAAFSDKNLQDSILAGFRMQGDWKTVADLDVCIAFGYKRKLENFPQHATATSSNMTILYQGGANNPQTRKFIYEGMTIGSLLGDDTDGDSNNEGTSPCEQAFFFGPRTTDFDIAVFFVSSQKNKDGNSVPLKMISGTKFAIGPVDSKLDSIVNDTQGGLMTLDALKDNCYAASLCVVYRTNDGTWKMVKRVEHLSVHDTNSTALPEVAMAVQAIISSHDFSK